MLVMSTCWLASIWPGEGEYLLVVGAGEDTVDHGDVAEVVGGNEPGRQDVDLPAGRGAKPVQVAVAGHAGHSPVRAEHVHAVVHPGHRPAAGCQAQCQSVS